MFDPMLFLMAKNLLGFYFSLMQYIFSVHELVLYFFLIFVSKLEPAEGFRIASPSLAQVPFNR
jgi:hypothetical protein